MTDKKKYIILISSLTVIIGAAVFASAFTFGARRDARESLETEKASLENAVSESEGRIEELTKKLNDTETELSTENTINNYYMEYQKTYDELKRSVEELKQQSAQLDSDIDSKTAELAALSGVKSEKNGRAYTLTSDKTYSCPDDIPEGRYTASGSGTIIISTAAGKTRATKNLDVMYDNSYTFNLSEREQIKVTGRVRLTELK